MLVTYLHCFHQRTKCCLSLLSLSSIIISYTNYKVTNFIILISLVEVHVFFKLIQNSFKGVYFHINQ
ncbi:hypothetical protein AQUCO_03700196v1 [Aquilegia coerulea]|uniref:Uncharacterized protein n=1 Tax=Aquilegia coerulea TaxID=218851 RepID=A0A2G5CV28_AQUCA|nr:hypothetical protein AQUCO_03700196v1 [Aquilegia coerulea]